MSSFRRYLVALLFAGFVTACAVGGWYVWSTVESIRVGLPMQVLNRHRELSSLIQTLSNLSEKLGAAVTEPSVGNLDELTAALDIAIVTGKAMFEKQRGTDREEIRNINTEIERLLVSLDDLLENAPPLDAVRFEFIHNRLGHAITQLEHRYPAINEESVLLLSEQFRQLGRFRTNTLLLLGLIVSGVLIMSMLLLWSYRTNARLQLVRAALSKNEARYQAIIEDQTEFISRYHPADGKRTFVNDAYCRFFGKKHDELLGASIFSDIPDDEVEHVKGHIASLAVDRSFRQIEHSSILPDGRVRLLQWNSRAIIGETGEVVEIQSVGRDITERVSAEEALKEAKDAAENANRAKSEFLATMSHDLRTPLTAIMGFAEMMEARTFGPLGDPHYEEYAEDILKSGNTLITLINDILDLSKIEAGKYILDVKPMVFSSLVRDAVNLFKKHGEEMKVCITTEIEPNLPMLHADYRATTQILNNLLSNAVKFTPEGGAANISAKVDGDDALCIQVADTGIGMTEFDIAKALEPFEQANSSHPREHEGTGLGLYICCKLMKLHAGTLDIESEIGKGTTVTLRFPREQAVRDT